MRKRKQPSNLKTSSTNKSNHETTNSSSSKLKKLLFVLSISLMIIIFIWQCIKFLQPGYGITYIFNNHRQRDSHYIKSHTHRVDKFLKSHKNGYRLNDINKYLIYPRCNTSVNISDLPQSLQTDRFCGNNNDCTLNALCHCPVASPPNISFAVYPKRIFPGNITNFGWQKHYNIGYPPVFNTSFIINNTDKRVREAWKLFKERSKMGLCNHSSGMWSEWTKPGYHKCVARIIGERLSFKPGIKVLDMGSGCGHSLIAWTYWFGIFGMGFDFESSNVLYANNIAQKYNLTYWTYHASIQSIYINEWIPNQSFDYIFSNAVIMYLDRNRACLVIKKSIQILKPNGKAWFVWNDKIPGINDCIQSYMNAINNYPNISFTWLNETDFLDTCSKSPSRPSFIIQRMN